MRGLSLFDIIVVSAVLALLVYLGSMEFPGYRGRTIPAAPVTTQEVP